VADHADEGVPGARRPAAARSRDGGALIEPRALKPSRKRNAVRLFVAFWLGALGVGGVFWGAWPLAIVLLGVAGWILAVALLVAFGPRAYELQLDAAGFRVHDVRGRVAHDVRWSEVVQLLPVNVNAYSFIVVAWVCSPRRPKHGRLRWRRGTNDDDGCMPDTYGMRGDELIALMQSYRDAGRASGPAPARPPRLEAF
jgi:hypothetical protein